VLQCVLQCVAIFYSGVLQCVRVLAYFFSLGDEQYSVLQGVLQGVAFCCGGVLQCVSVLTYFFLLGYE